MAKNKQADVVVIGGGAVGTSAAYHLAARGMSVILCEARNIASGASGRCGGQVIHAFARDVNIDKIDYRLKVTRANTEIYKEYQKSFELDFEFRQVGLLDISITEEEFGELERLIEIQRSLGDDEIKLLTKKETLEVMPNLNPDMVSGSRWRESDGNLNPYKLCWAQAVEAQKLGAEILTHTKVEDIVIEKNRVKGVRVKDGIIESEYVVNATNAWSSSLTKGMEVIPVREMAMVTERLPELPPQAFEMLCFGDYAYGATQTASGNYNLGGPAPNYPPDPYDERIYPEEVLRVMSYINTIFPSLEEVSVIRSWVGIMALTPDGMASIGPMPGVEGLFIAVPDGAGMSYAGITGKITAEYICDGKTSIPIDLLNPGRFIGKPKMKWPKPYDITSCHKFICDEESRYKK
ncbi:MAG: FAD-binding oxidoreductase [Spirochaetota bacterium]|nr:MAG: FAD-binding oxidoreductase [Spirochaetota bacterium]